jgi:glutamine amidotransferase
MIAIVKYNAGNIRSVQLALDRLGVESVWTDDPDTLYRADKVLFPGVGEASSAMRYLRERGLDEVLRQLQQPTLGICLGLQLFCLHSEEGETACLGIFDEPVRRFLPGQAHLKIPHMGWNTLDSLSGPLFKGIPEKSYVYFVHSFFATTGMDTTAHCQYGVHFSAAMQKNNFFAVQFHPEKSGPVGLQILANFLKL